MATVRESTATDEAGGATRAAGALGAMRPNHYVAIIGLSAMAFLWYVRRGSLRSLLDS